MIHQNWISLIPIVCEIIQYNVLRYPLKLLCSLLFMFYMTLQVVHNLFIIL